MKRPTTEETASSLSGSTMSEHNYVVGDPMAPTGATKTLLPS